MYSENRPWGNFIVLSDGNDIKVKIISIDPGQSISYQYHLKRSEHWIITKGSGELTIDDQKKNVGVNDQVFIPVNAKHKIRNNSDSVLQFVEVQTGEYFGEDDIIRLSDDYGRV